MVAFQLADERVGVRLASAHDIGDDDAGLWCDLPQLATVVDRYWPPAEICEVPGIHVAAVVVGLQQDDERAVRVSPFDAWSRRRVRGGGLARHSETGRAQEPLGRRVKT